MNSKVKKITLLSVATTILVIVSQISFYIGLIPISLSLLILFIISSIFSLKDSLIILGIYLILGLTGLPVFAGYKNIYEAFTSGTIGYIIGYIPCIILSSLIVSINKHKIIFYILSSITGTIICYIFGVIFYMILFKTPLSYTLSITVLPFIIFDIIKIFISSITSFYINKNIQKGSI